MRTTIKLCQRSRRPSGRAPAFGTPNAIDFIWRCLLVRSRVRRCGFMHQKTNKMSRAFCVCLAIVVSLIGCARAQDRGAPPLKLVQTISLPNVKGRLDHMAVDIKGKRLFVAGLENGTGEVVDRK